MRYTDIAIVGGGLAGSTAAAMLGRAGIPAVLIDPHPLPRPDFRVEKLSGNQQLERFRKTGIAESVLRWLWSESGGKLRGKVREGKAPDDAKPLMRVESEPLANLVRDMNKFSNNVMARQIFLALSAERHGQGDAASSARIVREWLESRGIDAPGLSIENGAGLSRDDRITAATLTDLLRDAWRTPLMPELAGSMPIFGADGTLKSRRAGGARGRAHVVYPTPPTRGL